MFPIFSLRSSMGFVVMHGMFWWLMLLLAQCNLDLHGDMVEVYAWSQHWLMGSDKHPQLLPWMAKLWFMIAPRNVASFYLFASINLCVGLLGIRALGKKLAFSDQELQLALALCVLAFPYLTLAAKINMNAISLATWPWAAWAFLVAATANTTHQRAFGIIAFAALAAMCLLGKYYSAVFLASLFLASLTKPYRETYRTITPYAACALMTLFLAPHLIWLASNYVLFAAFLNKQGGGSVDLFRLASFALAPFYYWIVPWMLCLAYLYTGPLTTRIARSIRLNRDNSFLWLLAVAPWAISLLFGGLGVVRLSEPWAVPIGCAYTLLLVRNADVALATDAGPKIVDAFHWLWPVMIIGGLVFTLVKANIHSPKHYLPEQEMADRILSEWSNLQSGYRLSWATSPGRSAARLAFFAPNGLAPEALPGYPSQLPAYYPRRPNWQQEAGVIICSLGRVNKNKPTEVPPVSDCARQARSWSLANRMITHGQTWIVSKNSWRHQSGVHYAYEVLFVVPAKN
jgi:hypothetical protein